MFVRVEADKEVFFVKRVGRNRPTGACAADLAPFSARYHYLNPQPDGV
jgi:hypothetical protein